MPKGRITTDTQMSSRDNWGCNADHLRLGSVQWPVVMAYRLVCSKNVRGDNVRDGTEYDLREATPHAERFIERWIENPDDCRMAIGHAPLTDRDLRAWLAADDQLCWILEGWT